MRNYLDDYSLIAMSAGAKQAALGTAQTLDVSLAVNAGTLPELEPKRETNKDERKGKEEVDTIYDLGNLSSCPLEFSKAQAHHFAIAYGFGLGSISSANYGSGKEYTISPADSIEAPAWPCFSLAGRFGNAILKRLLSDMVAESVKATFAKDSWAKLSIGVKGTGKYADNEYEESIAAAYNATSLNLAANGVQGSDAASRLDSIHFIRVQVPSTGEWVDVSCTAASAATPAVLTIPAPGGVATSTTYKVIYIPIEPAWSSFPSRILESPLRVTDLVVKAGGKWNGANFLGGHDISSQIRSLDHNVKNDFKIEGRPGGTGAYANYIGRLGREQTLSVDKDFRDMLIQRFMKNNENIGVSLVCTGAEFAAGYTYHVSLTFPQCGIIKAPIKAANKVLGETGDLIVMKGDTYPSVIVKIGTALPALAA